MSNPDTKHIDQLVDDAERISVIGSPSSTSELSLDILGTAVTKKLVGELALFKFLQDASTHYALGQITEVELHNIWHEDPTMRSLIRQRGRIDAVSERQDTHRGKMTVSAVFSRTGNNYAPSILGTVPATGTPTHIVDDNILDTLLQAYKSQMFYLGHVYGSTPKLPLWFKHFGNGNNGAGEAYHLGVFGKTGSGKSVLAKMILMGYAQHRQMGLFVFDPQGEFSQGLRDPNKPKQMGKVFSPFLLNGLARRTIAYDIGKIQLDRWEIFTELLREFGFFFELGIKSSQYQDIAAERVTDFLKRSRHTLGKLNDDALRDTLTDLHTNIHRVYANAGGVERVQEFINEVVDSLTTESLNPHPVKERWDKAIRFFAKQKDSKTPDEIIGEALNPDRSKSRPIVVLNLLNKPADITDTVWNEKIKPLIMDRFLNSLIIKAEKAYENEQSLNTLVVFDEAHRIAPSGKSKNDRAERIKSNLVDAVRTTRKYGLGWMFLSQTLSSLDNEIVQQLRIFFFGFGLSMGSEFQKLRELVGDKDSIKLYQSFRDPQSSFDVSSREYPFMTIGPVSPLSFSGTPLFLNAFNKVDDFVETNNLIQQDSLF